MVSVDEIAGLILSSRSTPNHPPHAFTDDLQTALQNVSQFGKVVVHESENHLDAFHANVTLDEGARSLQHVVELVQQAWVTANFPDFQATSVRILRDRVLMRFVTADEDGSFCFTGSISVSGGSYADLCVAFERDFFALPAA